MCTMLLLNYCKGFFKLLIKIDYYINLHLTNINNNCTLSAHPNHPYMKCQYPAMEAIALQKCKWITGALLHWLPSLS